jgi:hypothetical protein
MDLLEKLAALVPLPRVRLVHYDGCLAPRSHLREAIIPTPRQPGVDEEETDTGSPRWSWARLLQRVVALEMARCPFYQRGSLRSLYSLAGIPIPLDTERFAPTSPLTQFGLRGIAIRNTD